MEQAADVPGRYASTRKALAVELLLLKIPIWKFEKFSHRVEYILTELTEYFMEIKEQNSV